MPVSNLKLFLICVTIWGTTWLAITFELGAVAPEASVAYRFLLAAGVLFIYCKLRGLSLAFAVRRHVDLAAFGLSMFCVSYIFVYYAEIYMVSGVVAVAYSALPLVNMLGARIFFGTPMTRHVAGGAVLGVVGIVCVFYPEISKYSQDLNSANGHIGVGLLFTVLSVIGSSAGNMVAMRNERFQFPLWPSLAWGMFYGAAFTFIIALITGKSLHIELTAHYLLPLLYLALFGSIIAFAAFITLIGRIGATRASYVGVMAPVVALLLSAVFEHFAWTWLTSAGIVLLLQGNVLVLRERQSASTI